MYSPHSPSILSSLDRASQLNSPSLQARGQPSFNHFHNHHHLNHHHHHLHHRDSVNDQCLRFKYFTTFLICTTCLALLSGALGTHKWLVSKPIRLLKLNGNQTTNLNSLIRTAQLDKSSNSDDDNGSLDQPNRHLPAALLSSLSDDLSFKSNSNNDISIMNMNHNNKFQGEIYFGLFQGVKVLNYGFGDRVSHISVIQSLFGGKQQVDQVDNNQDKLINFKLWLLAISSVVLAILFALVGSIFAIINFVITPSGLLTGPIGLVIYNSAACFACLSAIVAWLTEFFFHLKANVLSHEEVSNGWTSENRSQFGYSFYFIVLAFILHLINIFIISLVQFEQWSSKLSTGSTCGGANLASSTTSGLSKSRQSRLQLQQQQQHLQHHHNQQQQQICEGVIMLY